jgi:hypothetical protein
MHPFQNPMQCASLEDIRRVRSESAYPQADFVRQNVRHLGSGSGATPQLRRFVQDIKVYGYNGYLLQHGTILTILFLTKSAATYEENIVSFYVHSSSFVVFCQKPLLIMSHRLAVGEQDDGSP